MTAVYWIDRNKYCENCSPINIYNFDYKPRSYCYHSLGINKDPDDSKLYLGVEVEVDLDSNTTKRVVAKLLLDYSNKEKLYYLKNDGSVRSGFEVVSQPSTLSFHQQWFPWPYILKTFQQYSGYADENVHAGLHVHITKQYLTLMEQKKLGLFINKQKSIMEILSRRCGIEHVCEYKDYYRGLHYEVANFSETRYEAVNFINQHTIEFRIFQSTLNYEILMATLELVHAVVLFIKTGTSGHAKLLQKPRETWNDFITFICQHSKSYIRLIPYLQTQLPQYLRADLSV
jgi:hypothetical protein